MRLKIRCDGYCTKKKLGLFLFKQGRDSSVPHLCKEFPSSTASLQAANSASMLPDGRRTNATPPAIRVPESSRASSPPPLRGHRSLAALSLHSTPADGSEYWGEESDSHALNPFWGLISTEASPTHRPQVTTTDNLKACRGCYGQDKRLSSYGKIS
jgi:hypothetical protein